jgi:hypothetical protein
VFVVASKEIGLEVNADKTKYTVVSWDQNARSHTIKRDNTSYESVEQFNCLGTILTNQNSFQREIKSRLKTGNELKVNLSFLSNTPNWRWRAFLRMFKFSCGRWRALCSGWFLLGSLAGKKVLLIQLGITPPIAW